MRSSQYDRRTSAAQTYSFDLIKMNNVTSNVDQPEPNKTTKITSFMTSAPYIGNTQYSLQVRTSSEKKYRDKDSKRWTFI